MFLGTLGMKETAVLKWLKDSLDIEDNPVENKSLRISESVLLSPKLTVSSMYYKQKLIVHNFTIFNLKTGKGYCFLWNETEGSVTSNEFATLVVYFLENEVLPKSDGSEEVILFSDGCTGQNRTSTLSNALLNFCMANKTTQSIRPGRSTGDAVVTNIKALKYMEHGQIHYKLRHTEDWQILSQRKKAIILAKPFNTIPSLYKERRKIKKEKYDHLQILKKSLDADYQKFYDSIPHMD
nr:unnamed protein product [Callosobruchus chinensis]